MITAVDTNVLIDVFGADPTFGRSSLEALKKCADEGSLIACEIIWIETATVFPSPELCQDAMNKINIEFSSFESDGIWIASKAWRNYRNRGGKRDRVAADFLIAAHSLTQANRLLTRDRGFYKEYFADLQILDPSFRQYSARK